MAAAAAVGGLHCTARCEGGKRCWKSEKQRDLRVSWWSGLAVLVPASI